MAKQKPGAHGLLALDWNNGNRTILVDVRLTGLLLGQTLHTKPHEIYRALIEATAFGALTIINRIEEYGVPVEEVVNCGGLAVKNATLMQIYADVLGRPMKVAAATRPAPSAPPSSAPSPAEPSTTLAEAQAEVCRRPRHASTNPSPKTRPSTPRLYDLYRTAPRRLRHQCLDGKPLPRHERPPRHPPTPKVNLRPIALLRRASARNDIKSNRRGSEAADPQSEIRNRKCSPPSNKKSARPTNSSKPPAS